MSLINKKWIIDQRNYHEHIFANKQSYIRFLNDMINTFKMKGSSC